MLDFDVFKRVVDEAGPSLVRIDFFNYGEAFLHKRAVEMCEYIKHKFPHIYLYTSTNGLAFSEEQVRRLIRSGIDEVTFSIDGATPRGRHAPAPRRTRRRSEPPFCRGREARRRQGRAVHHQLAHPLHSTMANRRCSAPERWQPGSASTASAGS